MKNTIYQQYFRFFIACKFHVHFGLASSRM